MNRLTQIVTSRACFRLNGRILSTTICNKTLLSNVDSPNKSYLKCNFSSLESAKVKNEFVPFRTNENDPTKHIEKFHDGMFYTIPKDIASRLFVLGGFDKEQQSMIQVFQETAIMIRKPALEIIDLLNRTDFNKPPNKFVLYGSIGSGKTYTLNHILHYGYNNKFVLLFCPKPTDWTRYPQEYNVSSNNLRRIDTPLDSAVWLQHFKTINGSLIEELNLKSLNKYTWSQREITNSGDPLMSIVEHGINRIKHASDTIAVLLKELKLHSEKRDCRLMLVFEKMNALYEPTLLSFPDRTKVTSDDITIARAFKKFFNQPWENGVLVGCVDKKLVVPFRLLVLNSATRKKFPSSPIYKHYGPFHIDHLSDYPKDLLTDKGFQDLDPFIPIEVPVYNEKEANNCLDYYNERNWLQRPESNTEEGRQEIKFLSGFNPSKIYEFTTNI